MIPEDCPRFHRCSASVCPLDLGSGIHLPGEPVCYYARNSSKAGAEDRFADDPVFAAVKAALPEVMEQHPPIRRAVELAARSGFQGAHLIGHGCKAHIEATDIEVEPEKDPETV